MTNALYWIEPHSKPDNFPPVEQALIQPDGLLCFGGDLASERLIAAYQRGIFPWYSAGQPIMWWSPSPRCVIYPEEHTISRSLRKTCRNSNYKFSMNQDFEGVIHACAEPRSDGEGTWITPEMRAAYNQLHKQGYAHSAEIWRGNELVGGLYGLAIGRIFFGESMFSRESNTSKMAMACLVKRLHHHGFTLIDCQVSSPHLFTLGAREIQRKQFIHELDQYCAVANTIEVWQTDRVPVREYLYPDE